MATFSSGSSLGSTIEGAEIADDTITNAKIKSDADIQRSKLKSSDWNYACGNTTKNLADASGAQNIAHGLGRVPKFVRISGFVLDATNDKHFMGFTAYDGTTQASWAVGFQTGTGSAEELVTTFKFGNDPTGGTYQIGVITFDATNIIITWTKTGAPTGTVQLIWEAE